eukprot:1175362-Prorocentrum_minimum.AAC.3
MESLRLLTFVQKLTVKNPSIIGLLTQPHQALGTRRTLSMCACVYVQQRNANKMPVGPMMLGFFLFVVVGSSLFQIIRQATSGQPGF